MTGGGNAKANDGENETSSEAENETPAPERSWLYNHIGRISGLILGLIIVAFISLLAAAGYGPALGLLIVIVVGVLLISLGSQLRGPR